MIGTKPCDSSPASASGKRWRTAASARSVSDGFTVSNGAKMLGTEWLGEKISQRWHVDAHRFF
jgi:hypothetical protein